MNGSSRVPVRRPGVESSVHLTRARRAGFTLIEILIVIAIVLALGAIVGVAVFQRRDTADIDMTKIQIKQIGDALDLFYLDYRRFPNDDEGVAVLWDKELLDPDGDETKWQKYMTDPLPRDLWNNDWGYRGEEPEYGEKYDLWSNGPDGEEDTEDDITAWSDSEGDEFGDDFGSDLPPPPFDGP
ncbi:MAG: type II secretion system major pseudopilin GspG [Phycisphaerales bacterium]|nr:type II secretion system major pseudopilin GspG [Phycisphaerales bacterium]